MSDDAVTNEINEIGLRTQNGTEIWPPEKYLGYSIATKRDREAFMGQMETSAKQMDMDQGWFLDGFRWITKRTLKIEIVLERSEHTLDDMPEEGTDAKNGSDQVH